jgi:hypothetical protein
MWVTERHVLKFSTELQETWIKTEVTGTMVLSLLQLGSRRGEVTEGKEGETEWTKLRKKAGRLKR